MPHTRLRRGLQFLANRLAETLWLKPLISCLLSVLGVFLAKVADGTELHRYLPDISGESVETLLSIMASSMLVIATLAVASIVSAYSSASNTASPRAFPLIIADDVSQYALSAFIGAFIFSLVGLIAVKNGYYESSGRLVLFLLTALVFAIIIFTFVTWIDRIARLGRLGMVIDKVADATALALKTRQASPHLGGVPAGPDPVGTHQLLAPRVGYLQHIDIERLQALAESAGCRIEIAALPGSFLAPGRALAYLDDHGARSATGDWQQQLLATFEIGRSRVFDHDPRYGFVVLAQIAGRSLSPAVNDPGTAIDIIGAMVRLFTLWRDAGRASNDRRSRRCDRILVPALRVEAMFDDAFTALTRDGADSVEVSTRLLKALASLAHNDDPAMQAAARRHARRLLAFARQGPQLPEDIASLEQLARF